MSATLTTALTSPILAEGGPGPYLGGHGGPFFPFFFLVPLFWLAVIVVVIVLGTRWRRRDASQRRSDETARRAADAAAPLRRAEVTLAERFARGDIDEAEYRKRLEVVRASAALTDQP